VTGPGSRAGFGAVILAAGTASRMGRVKQLLPFRGKLLLQHPIDTALGAGVGEIVLVLGHEEARIRTVLQLPREIQVTANPDFASGQASSLRVGLAALGPKCRAALILLGDQPLLAEEAVEAVLAMHEATGAPVVRAEYQGAPGHPVLLARPTWEEISAETGDRGAREWISRHLALVANAPLPFPPPLEVDTEEDYARLLRLDD
jgi:molybdenum cofactor cytidylyltransferase